jgi:Ca-activated chloride channel homolog
MARHILLYIMILTASFSLQAQNDRKVIREGVKSYEDGDFSEAEVQFRKAGDINHESFEAEFNTGAALYGQEKYEETFKQYETLIEKAEDPESMANLWHNMGNSLLESQKYQESIEAYKNSLRINPNDQDSKYNLAYAKQKLEEQQNQDKQDQENQDQQDQENQDQQDQENQDQQDQENQDQQDQENQDQEGQENQDQENLDQQDQENQENQDQENQDQQDQEKQGKPLEISREDAQRMLDAIQQQEKDVKDKVDKKKASAAKVKTEKDW